MLDVLSRSQRGRICEYRKGDGCLRTPAVLKSGEGECCIANSGNGRVLRLFGSEVSLDPQIMTTASSGVKCQPLSRDGIAVLRLPVTGDEVIPDDCEVVVVPNAFELRSSFRILVDQVMRVRRTAGFGRLVVMLGIAEPSNLALLAYMGVDVLDDGFARAAGVSGYSLLPEGKMFAGRDCS